MRKRQLVERLKPIIKVFLLFSRYFPKFVHRFVLRFVRDWDSLLAIFIRYICVKNLCRKCGDNIAIFSGVYLLNIESLELGDNISIHPLCYIDATGGILIESDVSIAHNVTIMSTEHIFENEDKVIKDQGVRYLPTIIKSNVWVGAGCRILAGAILNSGSVIAAGAVVKGVVNENSVVGGVPAKLIKVRKKNEGFIRS